MKRPHVAGVPSVTPFGFSKAAVEGGEVKVACMANGALRLAWSKDGHPINGGGNDGVDLKQIDDILVLRIPVLSARNSGNYTCSAENREGSSSLSAFLAVHAPPRWVRIPTDVQLKRRGTLELMCEASGFPAPVVSWKRHGGL